MRIQAINTNSFKGLFTDKSKENGGNWRMEYRPYSWESNNTSKMAPKVKIDEYANALPDNEEIFTRTYYPEVESSKDILGTESYYKRSNIMRRTITEMPAMNREESLGVLDQKLGRFIEIKKRIKQALENDIDGARADIERASNNYDEFSSDYSRGYWNRELSKDENKSRMDTRKSEMVKGKDKFVDRFNRYKKLINSLEAVRETKEKGREEIQKLGELRESGLLIDISRRDIVNPNEALAAALQNMREAANKVVCLPNKILSIEEILKVLGDKANASDIINYIEKIIKRRAI